MALLLAMYQKMALIREKNQLNLRSIQIANKIKRIKENIASTQKRYKSMTTQWESQKEFMLKQASVFYINQAGLSMGNNYSPQFNNAGVLVNQIAKEQLLKNKVINVPTGDGNETKPYKGFTAETFAEIQARNGNFKELDDKFPWEGKEYKQYEGGFNEIDLKLYQNAIQLAQQDVYNRQNWASQMSNYYSQDVSIFVDYQIKQLEAQQEMASQPLNYEETMLELEQAQIQERMEVVKNSLENTNKLVQESAEKSALKFGLA